MADVQLPADEQPLGADVPEQAIVISPNPDQSIVADTRNLESEVRYRPAADSDQGDRSGVVLVHRQRRHYEGPLPDPGMLREYAEIYPSAPKIILDEFKAQSTHRRDLERQRMSTSTTLALRGQIFAASLGAIGLIVSGAAACLGQPLTGFGFAVLSVGTLAGLFIYGQEMQKKELRNKREIRNKIDEGRPIEELEQSGQPDSP